MQTALTVAGHVGFEIGTDLGLGYRAIVYADRDSEASRPLVIALGVMIRTLENNGKWVSFGRAHKPSDGNPGDCLYVPPACLADLDEDMRRIARPWRLVLGELTLPEGGGFLHAWLQLGAAVVSVSNLKNGYPAYAMPAAAYYEVNQLQREPVSISPRSLRLAIRRTGGGNALARWLVGRYQEERKALTGT